MDSDTTKPNWSHLALAIGGGMVLGSLVEKNKADESRKSRAEKDDPEETADVCVEIGDLLENWEPDEDCETEDDFTQDLAAYVDDNCDWEVEVYSNSPEGKPDILIDDKLALEIKIGLKKGERDRLVGQCAGYSRLWVTWAIVIGVGENKIGRLVDLLEDKGLDHIAVWKF